MSKYKSWEDFINSDDELLRCLPMEFYVEKGNFNFVVEASGKKYFCSGAECNISDIYFNPRESLKHNCEFDSFYMFECENQQNTICNW